MKKILALTAAALLTSTASAMATIDIQFELVSVVSAGSDYKWTYNAVLQPDTNLRSAATVSQDTLFAHDFVTIHDIQGYVGGSAAFVNEGPYLNTMNPLANYTFAVSVQNLGLTPWNIFPDDLADVPNVTLSLTGGDMPSIRPLGTSAVVLGELSFHSIYPFTENHFSDFTSQTQKRSDLTTDRQIGSVETPAIPEGSTIFGFVPALAGMMARRRR